MGNIFTSQSKFNLRNCKTLAKMCWRGIKQNHFMSIKRVLSFIIFMMGSCYLIFDIICQFRHEYPLLLGTLIEMWLFFTFCHRWLAKYLTHKMLFFMEFIVIILCGMEIYTFMIPNEELYWGTILCNFIVWISGG